MPLPKALPTITLALLAFSVSLPAAHAQTTFAQYTTTAGNAYVFTNTGSSSSFSSTSVPVQFEFNVPTTFGAAGTPIPAILTISQGTVSATAGTASFGGKTYFDQPLGTFALKIAPVGSPTTNLLSIVSPTTGDITGYVNSSKTDITGDTQTGNTVTFTSDFLSFSSSTSRSYDLSASGISPAVSINANGYLNSFSGTGPGVFDSNNLAVTPEPNAAVSLTVLAGCLALTLVARRRRIQPLA